MRRMVVISSLLVATSSCATVNPNPAAWTFREVTGSSPERPLAANARSGEACAHSILGLVSFGDASVEAAAASGKIAEPAAVDYRDTAILGVYAQRCAIVRGSQP